MLDVDHERARSLALQTYEVMDAASEPAFDRITALAAHICQAPIALITFVTENESWIKSGFGTTVKCMPRSHSFCNHAIAQLDPLTVLDTHEDPRFATNPMVTGGPMTRFYCGVPLLTPEGVPIGALCVADDTPRDDFSAAQVAALRDLAGVVIDLLDHRRRVLWSDRATSRADLKDAIVARISRAPSTDAILGTVMHELGRSYGAKCGQLWRGLEAGRALRRTTLQAGFTAETEIVGFLEECAHRGHLAELASAAHRAGQPRRLSLTGDCSVAHDPSALAVFDMGADSVIAVPLSAGQEDYVILLGFDGQATDLQLVMRELNLLLDTLRPVLERRAEQEKLMLLSSALEATSDGVIITAYGSNHGEAARIAYVNESFCRATGHTAAELVGRSPDVLHRGFASGGGVEQLRTRLLAGEVSSVVLSLFRKNGSSYFAELDVAPIVSRDGEVNHTVTVQRDITAKILAERERSDFDRAFRVMFEANPLPMFVFDAQTLRFITVNDAAVAFYGWSRDAFLAMTVLDLQTEGEPADPRCLDGTRTMSERGIWAHRRADGSNVKLGGVALKHPTAGGDGVLAVMWDITEIEAARRELRRNYKRKSELTAQLRARTEELTNANKLARLGLWRLSPDRRHMTWSDEIYNLLGRVRAEFAPSFKHCLDVLHPEDRRLFKRSVLMPGLQQGNGHVELRISRPDGRIRRIRLELCQPQPGDEQGGWFGYAQDVTDRWETQEALMRSEKLAILGHLTGGVAHDFNNILTVVTLNLEEVIADLPETDEAQGLLSAALQAAQRGSDLTSQLLAYARQAPLRPKATSLATLFKTSGPLIRRALGNSYKLQVDVADERCTPLVDTSQLQTALLNIVFNAREAMPQGGEVLIEAAAVTLPSAEFRVDAPAGRYAMISVTDNGRGIEPDVLPHIFEPFYTTKGVTSSGLGLSMVEGFIGQSGGRILVQSTPGEGTTIRLFLPVSAEQQAAPANQDVKRALLVEDQAAVLATVSRMFTQLGYRVTAVQNAADALAKIDAGEAFDVMFADIGLPGGMDGITLAKIVSQRAPSVRILLTSGFTEHDPSRLDLPQLDILMKPYKRGDLLKRLNGVMIQNEAA